MALEISKLVRSRAKHTRQCKNVYTEEAICRPNFEPWTDAKDKFCIQIWKYHMTKFKDTTNEKRTTWWDSWGLSSTTNPELLLSRTNKIHLKNLFKEKHKLEINLDHQKRTNLSSYLINLLKLWKEQDFSQGSPFFPSNLDSASVTR